jgi:hypothetical protein
MFIICSQIEINFILSSQIWGNRKNIIHRELPELSEWGEVIERKETWRKEH